MTAFSSWMELVSQFGCEGGERARSLTPGVRPPAILASRELLAGPRARSPALAMVRLR